MSTIQKGKSFIDKHKLFVSKADGAAGQIGNPIPARIIGRAVIGDKNDVCTETFLVIGPLKDAAEAANIQQYMQTKFFRFMVGARKNKNMTQETYKYAPRLDFSKAWSDKELYELFDLTKDETSYIEEMISQMDDGGEE